jgi:hypothetical protein
VIVALAHPILNPQAQLTGNGPLLLVVDDGWAAARGWEARRRALDGLLDRAERANRPTMLLTTATGLAGEAPRPSRLARVAETRALAAALQPKPWPVDRAAARRAVETIAVDAPATVVYLGDGVEDGQLAGFVEALARLGEVEHLRDAPRDAARLMLPPTAEPTALGFAAQRLEPGPAELIAFRLLAEDGRLLAREPARFAEGETRAATRIVLPPEIRNRVVRAEIEGEASAGGVVLLDERFRRRPVGIAAAGGARAQPLLAETYYLQRALAPLADLRSGGIPELLQRELAVLALADVGRLSDGELAALEAWVRKGGLLLRFAGPRLAEGADALVPVPLRSGGSRNFGGALSWAQPAALAPFDPSSPFAGLSVPEDVRISRQVLAEPSLDLAQRSWARLADGTPLVTADRRGDGWIVLVHTTATPEWSTLALSGLFVEMLQRIVALSQGVAGEAAGGSLPPVSTLDGFGRLDAPPPAAAALAGTAFARQAVEARHPPGWYGADAARRALNLSANLAAFAPVAALPPGTRQGVYAAGAETDARPWLLLAALALLLLDFALALWLRGGLGAARRAAATLLAAALLGAAGGVADAAAQQAQPRRDDEPALIATLSTHLAYVRSGVQQVDETTRAGLVGLGAVLSRRTAIDPGPPVDLDVETDELSFFPLIYWPIVVEAPRPSPAALARVQRFLKTGGMILFDTRELEFGRPGAGGGPAAQRLRDILRALDLPPLAPVPQGHVLTKAFYLLSEFPGRYAGAPVWVEADERATNDGVTSVIVGAHDWAAAWATDRLGRPLYAAVPGGETQREFAVRFGVNVAMYALTGSYKGDQVHVDSILERLRR